jgi:hypothetical protein
LGAEKKYFEKFKILLKSFWQNPGAILPFCRSRFDKYITRRKPNLDAQVRKELRRLGLHTLPLAGPDKQQDPSCQV